MKKVLLLFVFLALFSFCGNDDSSNSVSDRLYQVNYLLGKVTVSKDDSENWEVARIGTLLGESAEIKTETDAVCELVIPDRGIPRVEQNSQVAIKTLNDNQATIQQTSGEMSVAFHTDLEEQETFEVETSTAVAAIRGTQFLISADDSQTEIIVRESQVAFTPRLLVDSEEDPAIAETLSQSLEIKLSAYQGVVMQSSQVEELQAKLDEMIESGLSASDIAGQLNQMMGEMDIQAVDYDPDEVNNRFSGLIESMERSGMEDLAVSPQNETSTGNNNRIATTTTTTASQAMPNINNESESTIEDTDVDAPRQIDLDETGINRRE